MPEAAAPIRPAADPELLEAVETQLRAWNRLFDSAYQTCNASRFFDDFKCYSQSLSDDRSLFVLLKFAVNGRYAGLVDRLCGRHPVLTGYELEMLCMLRFGFTFNSIRLLHCHENMDSLYSRRTKIHSKLHLPPRYPIEKYLSELSEPPNPSEPSEPSEASRAEVPVF